MAHAGPSPPTIVSETLLLPYQVSAKVVLAEPPHACDQLDNYLDVKDRIVIADRGKCMFVHKARAVEDLGAVGIVIIGKFGTSTSRCVVRLRPKHWKYLGRFSYKTC